jgi:hypothetical protein
MVRKDESDRIKFYEIDRSADAFRVLAGVLLDKIKTPAEILKDRLGTLHGSEPRIFTDREDTSKIVVVSSLIDKSDIEDITGFVKEELGIEINPVLFSNTQFIEMKRAGFVDSRKLDQV